LDYKYNDEEDTNSYYTRSDHYNFAQHNIPVIFYFNGEHDDYHQPTDTAEKLNYPLLEKRTKLIFTTAWYLANSKKRISVDKK
jgi:Zn-dependent M28 family amino/carboxypeptidase